jgi:hypothetical protein
MARSTGMASGLLVMVLGIWGALIPFIGPYFDYSFGTNTTWHFTTDRLWLDILPGALAVLAGVLLLMAASRAAGILAGWLGVIAGAWFAVGPAVSVTWESGTGPIGRPLFGSTRQMLELVGYFYGLGALIVALAAFSIGRFASRPRLAEQRAIARGAGTGTVTQAPPPPPSAAAPSPSERPGRRLFPFPRRGRGAARGRPGRPYGPPKEKGVR